MRFKTVLGIADRGETLLETCGDDDDDDNDDGRAELETGRTEEVKTCDRGEAILETGVSTLEDSPPTPFLFLPAKMSSMKSSRDVAEADELLPALPGIASGFFFLPREYSSNMLTGSPALLVARISSKVELRLKLELRTLASCERRFLAVLA